MCRHVSACNNNKKKKKEEEEALSQCCGIKQYTQTEKLQQIG